MKTKGAFDNAKQLLYHTIQECEKRRQFDRKFYRDIDRGIFLLEKGDKDGIGVLRNTLKDVVVFHQTELEGPVQEIIDVFNKMLQYNQTDTEPNTDESKIIDILREFESAMRRWRWDKDSRFKEKEPIKWLIREEEEIQDILFLILRSVFQDLVDENNLPPFGHDNPKADFGLPSLGTLIEVKYVRDKNHFKRIERELVEDSIKYLKNTRDYHSLIFFIYDESCSVQHHAIIVNALKKLDGVLDVVIVSRPSHIPRTQINKQIKEE